MQFFNHDSNNNNDYNNNNSNTIYAFLFTQYDRLTQLSNRWTKKTRKFVLLFFTAFSPFWLVNCPFEWNCTFMRAFEVMKWKRQNKLVTYFDESSAHVFQELKQQSTQHSADSMQIAAKYHFVSIAGGIKNAANFHYPIVSPIISKLPNDLDNYTVGSRLVRRFVSIISQHNIKCARYFANFTFHLHIFALQLAFRWFHCRSFPTTVRYTDWIRTAFLRWRFWSIFDN